MKIIFRAHFIYFARLQDGSHKLFFLNFKCQDLINFNISIISQEVAFYSFFFWNVGFNEKYTKKKKRPFRNLYINARVIVLIHLPSNHVMPLKAKTRTAFITFPHTFTVYKVICYSVKGLIYTILLMSESFWW